LHSHQESGAEFFDGAEFLTKLEEACGCHVRDSLKASLLKVIEDHCNHCLPSIPIDLVSLGALPVELKTMFSKLMNHVYSFKQSLEELVIKVLKEFADYESSSDPPTVSPVMSSASKNVNAIHELHDSQVLLIFLFLFVFPFLIHLNCRLMMRKIKELLLWQRILVSYHLLPMHYRSIVFCHVLVLIC